MELEFKNKYDSMINLGYSKIEQVFKKYKKIYTKPKKRVSKLLIFILLFTIFGPLIIFPTVFIMVFMYEEIALIKVITNIILASIIILPIWMIIRFNKKNKKALEYEEELYPVVRNEILFPTLKNELVGFDYNHSKGIDVYTFKQASLNERYDRFYSSDYIQFEVCNNHVFAFSNVLTEIEEQDDEGRTYYSTQFVGLVGKTTLPLSINGKVEISSLKGDKNKINIDMSEFEEYFEVTSNDEIKALQVLTHDVMIKLIEFRKLYNMKYDLVINNDNMYIRIYNNKLFNLRYYEDFINDIYIDIEKVFNIKNIVQDIFNIISNLII